MSATETQTPAPGIQQRRCPRCGAALTGEQEWCLECGAGVGATVGAPPNWRGPVALVAVLLTIAAAAVIVALVELAGDPEQVTEQPAAATPPPAATPAPALTPTPEATTIPPASDDGSAGTTPEIADWPAGKDAWTVVLESSATEEAARTRAQELAEQGVPVGILDSDDYPSIEPGRWVVFSGQYDSQRAADQALGDLSDQVEGAYVRHVSPSGDSSGGTSPGATATPIPAPTP